MREQRVGRGPLPRAALRSGAVAATTLAVVASSAMAACAFSAAPHPTAAPPRIYLSSHIKPAAAGDDPFGLLDGTDATDSIDSPDASDDSADPPAAAARPTAPTRPYRAHRAHRAHQRKRQRHRGGESSDTQARRAVREAYAQLGKPYVWGGNGPSSFDCSGLTRWVWRSAGVHIPRTSQQQAHFGRSVRLADIRPGDLVIYFPTQSHVGIYIGKGHVIVSPHPGAVVRISPLRSMPISTIRRP